MNSRRSALVLAFFLVVLTLAPLCPADTAEADTLDDMELNVNEVTLYSPYKSFEIDANSRLDFHITLRNNAVADTPKRIGVSADIGDDGDITAELDNNSFILNKGEYGEFVVTISADKFARAESYTLKLTMTAVNLDNPLIKDTKTAEIGIDVSSQYATGNQFNKILGVFSNPIDQLNIPAVNMLLTAIIWIFLAIVLSFLVTHFIIRNFIDNDRNEVRPQGQKELKSIRKLLFVIIILFGIANCMRVMGAEESVVGAFTDVFNIVAYAVGALLCWKAYKVIVYNIVVRMDKADKVDDSILPLLYMIGKIVIAVVAVSMILSVLGLDLGAIVASAGLVTLGISLGAQNTLNQFFCGMVLMATRPFRIGDKIKLGTDGEVLIVRKISVMDTEFKKWLNEEVFRIPNSTVMASTIVNITLDDKAYKVVEYFDVDYNADIDKARDIIMDVVTSHPKVITDGSKDRPQFRFESMDSSSVKLRVSYVVPDHEIYLTTSCQIKEAVFRRFKAEGIVIPYNIVDVHMVEE